MTTLLRYVVALVLLAALASRRPGAFAVARRDLPLLVALGLFGVVGYHYFFFVALRHTEVANTAIINSTSPAVTGLAAALFLGERLKRRQYAGVAVSFAGVLLLISRGNLGTIAELQVQRGDALMLVSVVSWVVYALLVKRLLARYSSLTLTFHAALWGVVILLPLVWSEPIGAQLAAISGRTVAAVLYMGLGASGLGYLLYNITIDRLGPTRTASIVYSALPVLVALLAYGFFAEPVTGLMLASIAIIVTGLNLTSRA